MPYIPVSAWEEVGVGKVSFKTDFFKAELHGLSEWPTLSYKGGVSVMTIDAYSFGHIEARVLAAFHLTR